MEQRSDRDYGASASVCYGKDDRTQAGHRFDFHAKKPRRSCGLFGFGSNESNGRLAVVLLKHIADEANIPSPSNRSKFELKGGAPRGPIV